MNKKLLLVIVTFMALLLLAVGCSKSESSTSEAGSQDTETIPEHTEAEKAVTLLYSFSPSNLDPHAESITVRAGVTETLVKVDENLVLQPWLAESWEQVDERTWKFQLRDGVTFHDGTPMDAAAVKASFERALEFSKSIQNLLKLESIEAEGQVITFQTIDPYPSFVSELVHTSASVVQVNAENIETAPIGTGPFQITSYTQDVEIQLERFEDYWDGAAKLSRATVKFNGDGNVRALSLQSNDADIAYHLPAESIETVTGSGNISVESIPSLRVHFVLYNSTKPAIQDVRVRQAIDAIINRHVIAEEIMNGHATPANGPFNPSLPFGSEKAAPTFNPEAAKSLLEEAGYTLNAAGKMEKDGETLSLKLATYNGRPELPLMAQYIQAEAASIGVEIEIVTVENVDSYLFEQIDEWDMVTYSMLTAPRGDGGYFFNVAFLPEGGLNPGQINIAEINALVAELNQMSDQAARNELQQQAVDIVMEQVPHSYIVFPHIIVGMNENVTNWKPGAEEYYMITNTLDVK